MLALYADLAGLLTSIQILILYFRLRRMGHGWGSGNSPAHRLAKEAAILRLLPQISLIAVPTQGVYKTLPGCIVHENNGTSTNANKVQANIQTETKQ